MDTFHPSVYHSPTWHIRADLDVENHLCSYLLYNVHLDLTKSLCTSRPVLALRFSFLKRLWASSLISPPISIHRRPPLLDGTSRMDGKYLRLCWRWAFCLSYLVSRRLELPFPKDQPLALVSYHKKRFGEYDCGYRISLFNLCAIFEIPVSG